MNMARPKILIVDDVVENIDILVSVLKGDYALVAAKDGEKALQLAYSEPQPDLILLDIMMPKLDGYGVCRALKSDPATRNIPILFITALDGYEDEAKGLRLGGIDYITKPFRPDLIKARVANHIELKRYREKLESLVDERTRELAATQEATIHALANLAETRHPETGGHIRRTQNYVKLLAEQLRDHPRFSHELDDKTIDLIYKSAPLHDVGKVGVPDSILLKPEKLCAESFEEMKRHAEYGSQSLTSAAVQLGTSSFLRFAEEIALTHHEKWDGTGYPQGLKGDEIPISGRLMALADVYDALISKRVYKPPYSHAKAVSIIEEGRGSHFDPDITDAFLTIHEQFRNIALEFADSKEERDIIQEPGGMENPD